MSETLAWLSLLLILVVVGESAHVRLTATRGLSPISSAAAAAFMLSLPHVPGLADPLILLLGLGAVAIAVGLGTLVASSTGRPVLRADVIGRLTNALVAGVLGQLIARSGLEAEVAEDDQRWIYALALALAALAAVTARVLVIGLMGRWAGRRFSVTVQDEAATLGTLSLASATTAVMIVLSRDAVGLWGPILFMIPLVLSFAAARRYALTRQTYRETIAALSRLTDLAGYTPTGHAQRVAELAVALAHRRGLTQRQIDTIEYAALLHDLGQVVLDEPIPGGATVLAAPRDQERIATGGVAIMRHSGVLEDAAGVLSMQAAQYRQVLEEDARIPIEARIVKLANAYEDLSGGSSDPAARSIAIERIHLGLGYEYDPQLVDDLVSILAGRTGPAEA